MSHNLNLKKILEMIETNKVSPQEGQQLIQELKRRSSGEEDEQRSNRTTYQAVILERPGKIEDIQIKAIQPKEPAANEVQILVKAFSLNFGDLLCMKGLYPTTPDYPFTPGFEVSGVVLKTGQDVKRVQTGNEVIALMSSSLGGHGMIVNTEAKLVVKKPKKISFEEACSFPVVFLTMYHVFEKAMVKKGEKILIQTAAGGTGLIAVQLAQLKGAEIFATAGSQPKLDYLSKMGVRHLINYREEDFADRILELTHNYGVDIVINTLSGEAIQKGLNILAPGGRYFEIAMTGLKTSNQLNLSNLVNNQTFHSVDLRRLLSTQPELVIEYLDTMADILEKGTIKPTVGKVFSFPEIREAYHYLENRGNIGKLVVTTPPVDQIRHQRTINVNSPDSLKLNSQASSRFGSKADIAVIGISGRFPGAGNVAEFWQNLSQGKSSITEVPPGRWDINQYYDPNVLNLDGTNCKWGGFLDNIDRFDPLFFNISGKEAEFTDPQQRIFLEECWNALEDAGYANKTVSNTGCGVFVGVGAGDYMAALHEQGIKREPQFFLGNNSSILAARISYFLNLKGPSVAIDTACSSSLVAIHLGCQSILTGDCDMVLAGGSFIRITPDFFISSSNSGMLSPDGKCMTFDDAANGFVPGEGVGVVVLKSLDAALRDHDQIYGVIKSSSINQDGKTNGITAPSTLSQTELELAVYQKAAIDPATIGLVETHGTGTKLGDPIEIEALTNAFRKYTDQKQFCAVGSVKTNIGHSVTAAGVASVIKVLLALKHKQLPPSLNFSRENRHINFKDSPFYVNTELQDWVASGDMPRRAAVSSFGFSGTNAHLVLEEAPDETKKTSNPMKSWYLAPFSARTKTAFNRKIENFERWLEIEGRKHHLNDICFTLLAGKASFPVRAALVVRDRDDLLKNIKTLINQGQDFEETQPGQAITSKKLGVALLDELQVGEVSGDEYRKKLLALADLYTQGHDLEWGILYQNEDCRRISLPTYPFDRKRYWIPGSNESFEVNHRIIIRPHPMIGRNTSGKDGQQYTTLLTGNEFYLADHVVGNQKVLPGVAYIEMARAAGDASGKNKTKKIRNIIWSRPIRVTDSPLEVKINLKGQNGEAAYEIFSHDAEHQKIVHNQGKLVYENDNYEKPQPKFFDIDSIKQRCSRIEIGKDFYPSGKERGLSLGPSFQVIKEAFRNETESLSLIELPFNVKNGFSDFGLHPSLIDGSLQTALIGIKSDTLYIPFSLGEVEILNPLTDVCYIYSKQKRVRDTSDNVVEFDILILSKAGQILTKIQDFLPRPFNPVAKPAPSIVEATALPTGNDYSPPPFSRTAQEAAPVNETDLLERFQKDAVKMVSKILRFSEADLKLEKNMSEYGFESLNYTEFANEINQTYSLEIMPAVFFEYQTLGAFVKYLYEEYRETLFQYYQKSFVTPPVAVNEPLQSPFSRAAEQEAIISETDVMERLQKEMVKMVSKILRLSEADLKLEKNMSEYGFESLNYTEFANEINQTYALEIMPAIFFEYQTLSAFVRYLYQEYRDNFVQYYRRSSKFESPAMEANPKELAPKGENDRELPENIGQPPVVITSQNDPIAIVGMSGVMPQSEDLEAFWGNLEQGRDLITEIPPDRWDWKECYGDPSEPNKTNVKWGGFMNGVDQFDPLFFGISPKEAEMMDPQQRILMETVWKTIEDAGYKPSDLSGTKTGLFVGVATSDYAELIKDHAQTEAQQATGLSRAILVNRISFLLNIHGPSEPVDTACSSALVAIHRAVEAIKHGDCEMAIAGGVNVIASPALYIAFSKSGMLCEDGRCKTFDKRANGYVRGEGVGAIMLKPLSRARAEGDHIYAVIKGNAVNHGGRSNSLTAPNPNAQADLLIEAWEKSGLDPSTVTYIEAHGTGTSLGDPVEVNGLKKAFRELYKKRGIPAPAEPHCGIGSVKTNIGHLETASGIAGVFKVLLGMGNQKIPASINFEELNPYIQLKESPFYVVKETIPWKCLRDQNNHEIPRRAGISSFGFGGANAHIILEEYHNPIGETRPAEVESGPQMLLLSAKNEERLKIQAQNMVNFLKKNQTPDHHQNKLLLADTVYTSQVGREAMEERLALIGSDIEALIEGLNRYIRGKVNLENLYVGNIYPKAKSEKDPEKEMIQSLLDSRQLAKLAQLWVAGVEIDWKLLYIGRTSKRISLPTYPFARESCWIKKTGKTNTNLVTTKLHPLVDRNVSTLNEERFATRLIGNEFYLTDHVLGTQMVLPGAAYIEMARAAGEIAGERDIHKIKNILWARPIIFTKNSLSTNPPDVFISLAPGQNAVNYEISSIGEEHQKIVNSQGEIEYLEKSAIGPPVESVNIDQIKKRCLHSKSRVECYALFQQSGLNYGPGFQTIQELYYNETEGLSLVELPEKLNPDFETYRLHPAVLDGAFQTVIGLMGNINLQPGTPYLPFALGEIEIRRPLPQKCYAYVTFASGKVNTSNINKFNINIMDGGGVVLVKIKDLSTRAFQQPAGTADTTGQNIKLNQNRDYNTNLQLLLQNIKSGKLNAAEADKLMEELYG
jgi:acyl transferase domain-containing protein/NADPH:quinone reductase-like Zn-dependent oxidoreductase/acyl carrier protein